jgi:membrane-associated phospholipid phosphatase
MATRRTQGRCFHAFLCLSFALCACVLARGRARAEAPYELHHDLRLDIPITALAITLWAGSHALQDKLAPDSCRLCGDNALDRATRDGLLWQRSEPAHRASNWFSFGVVPVFAFSGIAAMALHAGEPKKGLVDALLVTEATALAVDLNQLIKFTVARRRPFVFAKNQDVLVDRPKESDDNMSFYSGHTNLAFALVASTGTVATLRGYRAAPWVWGMGLPLAAASGYFRIAADRHYLTDVLTGALLGSAVGVLVPWLFHGRKRSTSGSIGTGSEPLSLSYTWVH